MKIELDLVLKELDDIKDKYHDERYRYHGNPPLKKLVNAKLRAIKFARDRINKLNK